MFKSRLIMTLAMVFFAMVIVNPTLGLSDESVNPDLAAGKGGGKPQKYLGLSITGQTITYEPGDDGDLEKGVSWPVPRFSDNGDGTVTDNLTRLVWLKDPSLLGTMLWSDALAACAQVHDGLYGLTDGSQAGDWRLPNIRELESLIDFSRGNPCLPLGHPFMNVPAYSPYGFAGLYWSSTTLGGVAQPGI